MNQALATFLWARVAAWEVNDPGHELYRSGASTQGVWRWQRKQANKSSRANRYRAHTPRRGWRHNSLHGHSLLQRDGCVWPVPTEAGRHSRILHSVQNRRPSEAESSLRIIARSRFDVTAVQGVEFLVLRDVNPQSILTPSIGATDKSGDLHLKSGRAGSVSFEQPTYLHRLIHVVAKTHVGPTQLSTIQGVH